VNGARTELELSRFLVEEEDARDVARQQVGCELDAGERPVDAARQRLRERGLADPRYVLNQHVPLAQERDR
jgi:hypothetical protein